ncbi:MAG: glucoamylase family protein [Duganella sp.]
MSVFFKPRALHVFASLAFAVSAAFAGAGAAQARDAALPPMFDDLQRRTFDFFWDTANPSNGLVPDRYPTPSFSSVAAVGFGLTAYPIGVERGYITRQQARDRVLATLRFFRNAPQGDAQGTSTSGHKGFFYHFLDMKTGLRYDKVELSTVDTALFLAGALFCQSYFDGDDSAEKEIRKLAVEIYERVDWTWAQARKPSIALGWHPESGFIGYDWKGYNEAMLVYVLALGSPTHPVQVDAWKAWTSTYANSLEGKGGKEHLAYPSLFIHQYSHVWIDFRGIRDEYMRERGYDYFENSRRATYAQQAYAIANPLRCKGYGTNVWGITASDGPVDKTLDYGGIELPFRTYTARGIGGLKHYDDCTLAPTAAASSLPFAPEIVVPTVLEMKKRYGDWIYGRYGFLDAFNPSFDYDIPVSHGRTIKGKGWVDNDYLGIDQGPIIAMTENYRSDLVWRVMRNHPVIRLGLERAGFTGGWLRQPEAVKPAAEMAPAQ